MNANNSGKIALGKLVSVEEVLGACGGNNSSIIGSKGAHLGICGMMKGLFGGGGNYDGYKIKTEDHEYLILIDNDQCCCEDWGYFSSDDNFSDYIGKQLIDVVLTDTALNQKRLDEKVPFLDEGGIQFVDFHFADNSKLQFAVYNAHNGCYGHSIVVVIDQEILLRDIL